jgi:hypothetical protein
LTNLNELKPMVLIALAAAPTFSGTAGSTRMK